MIFLGIILSNIPIGKARTADPSSGVWLMLHLLSLLVVAVGIAFLICFWRGKIRQYGLACPVCEKAIVGAMAQTAKATGLCRECGARIVEEEPEEEAEKKGCRQYHQIEETAHYHHPLAEGNVFPDSRRQPARQEKVG